MIKVCTICRKEKSEFNKNKNRKDGLEERCRDCALLANREYRKKRNDTEYKYVPRDPERRRRLASDWQKENPKRVKAKARKHWLKKKYGLTVQQYSEMFSKQNGKCFICERDSSEFKKGLVVDHCHETGVIRKLLCGECNTGLGKFMDKYELLIRAARYIKSNSEQGQGQCEQDHKHVL